MALRYKGVPEKGANKIADKLPDFVSVALVAVGFPLNDSECSVHDVKLWL